MKLGTYSCKVVNGSVGTPRSAVDAGYASYDMKMGQAGTEVSPKLYIASGAVQHLAGISASDYIIVINIDRKVPIFNSANYGVIGDLHKVIEEIIFLVRRMI